MGDFTYILYPIPSGKLLHSYGKSTMLIGILIINGPFSIAMLVYQMVYPFIAVLGMVSNWFFHSQWLLMFQKCFFSISLHWSGDLGIPLWLYPTDHHSSSIIPLFSHDLPLYLVIRVCIITMFTMIGYIIRRPNTIHLGNEFHIITILISTINYSYIYHKLSNILDHEIYKLDI